LLPAGAPTTRSPAGRREARGAVGLLESDLRQGRHPEGDSTEAIERELVVSNDATTWSPTPQVGGSPDPCLAYALSLPLVFSSAKSARLALTGISFHFALNVL